MQGQSICKPSSETAMCTCRNIECSMPAPSTENHVFAATQLKNDKQLVKIDLHPCWADLVCYNISGGG